HPERSFAFIIGADNISELRNWHKPEEICRAVRLVAGARPGYELAEIDVPAGCTVEFFDTGEVDVSGSEIRRRLAEGLDREELVTLVPSAVADYIFDKGLYRA
ncbi:nicotinate-nucleotide adenylyltransferase, partial [candidate division GN15 bacterium]|nr:nicotinate-nucleotide adenylyltransferase [candidate division GN15 bacterium]